MRIAAGEFKGVVGLYEYVPSNRPTAPGLRLLGLDDRQSIVNTLNRDDSVKWLIHKMECLRASFDPNNLPTRTKEAFDTYVKSRMKAPTFQVSVQLRVYPVRIAVILFNTIQEYLRLMKKDKIGDKKAMRIILDPALNWDKNFISPREAQSAKTTLSTLEDRATYWKESEVAATHRNLANTKRRALYEGQKARGPVLGDDDCACGVCSRHIDVFSVDDDIIGCDRFKDCGACFTNPASSGEAMISACRLAALSARASPSLSSRLSVRRRLRKLERNDRRRPLQIEASPPTRRPLLHL